MKKLFGLLTLLLISFCSFANPLPAEDVFKLHTKLVDPNTFNLEWTIKPGYFLYKDKIQLQEKVGNNFNIGPLRFPPSVKKTDRLGKVTQVYKDKITLSVPVLGIQAGESILDILYQGCSEDGFCYPPQRQQVKLTIDKQLYLSAVDLEEAQETEATSPSPASEVDEIFSSNNWVLIILSFFSFGLLLAFTPCVLPMVPVLSGIIVGHGKDLTTRKAFLLSFSYVLSMSITYAAVGAVVALMGSNLQIVMQSPWAIGLFSGIFILLSLSMFNLYDLRLPLSWQSKFASVTRNQSSGHYLGAAVMGSLSTLILSPCVTAPLIGALGYIANTGNIALGSLALFFLGLGMGTPLLLIGTSAGKLLPKAGRWMNGVKLFFGIILLAMAIYLLARIVPAIIIMVLWACLFTFTGVYLGALTRSTDKIDKLKQAAGIILLVYGLLILIGASKGNTNPLQPLVSHPTNAGSSEMKVVKSIAELQRALEGSEGRPIFLDFYADWCTSCKVIAATTLQDPKVVEALRQFLVLKVDLTANDADSRDLLRYFNIVAPPSFLFLGTNGKELPNLRLVGEISQDRLVDHLNKTLASP
jgi:thiol:disulfide interchange protein DsbD